MPDAIPSAPLSAAQLDAIEAEWHDTTGGPWWNESGVVHAPWPDGQIGAACHPLVADEWEDAEWAANAHEVMPRLIALARDALALREAAQRIADEAQRMVDNPGRGPGGLQQPLVDLREALNIGAITINDYRRKLAEQELAAGRATAGTKEGTE